MKPKNSNEKYAKREIKKLEDILPFDPFRALGLRPKKIDEEFKKYAGLNKRMIAATIDSIIAAIVIGPVLDGFLSKFIVTKAVTMQQIAEAREQANADVAISELLNLLIESGTLTEFLLSSFIQMLVLLVASGICWKLWSATPGKMLFRMKVVDVKTNLPISDKQIMLRCLGYILSCGVLFLGVFWIGLNKRHQGWHDKIAGTAVITAPKKDKQTREVNKGNDEI